jgi:SWI/SNF-related matrix-associated actin-dependent regulator of chromatin subfamily A member 5
MQLQQTSHLTIQPAGIKGQLRSYQLEGVNWLLWLYDNHIHGILADEMVLTLISLLSSSSYFLIFCLQGLGKTLQTLALLLYLKVYLGVPGPHLIIGPKSTMGGWMNEVHKFTPSLRAVLLHGAEEERVSLHFRFFLSQPSVANFIPICV